MSSYSIKVAMGASSYVYIEVWDKAEITSPAKAEGWKPDQNGLRKFA
jgi:hypothetical protein